MTQPSFTYTASPNEAESHFQEFCRNYKSETKKDFDTQKHPKLITIFGNSRFLGLFLIKNPSLADKYTASIYKNKEKSYGKFCEEITKITQGAIDPINALKRYKYTEFLRLTIKELLGLDQSITYRELSFLAIAISENVLKFTHSEIKLKHDIQFTESNDYAIIAMGKLGGGEVNYSSDIDLIGLYDTDEKLNSLTKHEFYQKLFVLFGKRLTSQNEHGFLYRVDWDLRPEGKSGTLANSLNAMEKYYVTFCAEWERQAYIKANPLFQQNSLGNEFLKLMQAIVYRKSLDEESIKSIWSMKEKIHDELSNKKSYGINIKLGKGGIRDIEFFTQGLQLIYGGRNRDLRKANTLLALEELAKLKLIDAETKEALSKSYLYLRRLESCLQMENEQQTHTLKSNASEQLKVARRMGIFSKPDDAINQLNEQLFRTTAVVHQIFSEAYGN
jgi:[glutamine synthetase] adenylyltransferase / [glutamine synthetase]-adenylyl-L-tyrosine phosphorylase